MDEAFVSLTTNDEYAIGALVLGKSLKNTGTTRKLVLMVTAGVSAIKRDKLKTVWDEIVDITLLDSQDKENLALLARPELGCTFSKLRAWTLTQFTKCVFLDADTLILQNVDDLFERDELSAVADVGWPDCFNSGVFVFKPNMKTYDELLNHAKTVGSFDGGDQGLLNDFFSDWSTADISRHLPFTYNMVSNICYSYAPAFKRFGRDVKIVHFLGLVKPWHHHFDHETGQVVLLKTNASSLSDTLFTKMWWDLFNSMEESVTAPIAAQADLPPSWQKWQDARTPSERLVDRKATWEAGRPDYTGEDQFDNILKHLSTMMLSKPSATISTAVTSSKTSTTDTTTKLDAASRSRDATKTSKK